MVVVFIIKGMNDFSILNFAAKIINFFETAKYSEGNFIPKYANDVTMLFFKTRVYSRVSHIIVYILKDSLNF